MQIENDPGKNKCGSAYVSSVRNLGDVVCIAKDIPVMAKYLY